MAWNTEHKSRSRENILSAAALLFTHRGFDEVSIDDVMQQAGLTRGAFYAHFKSKADIYKHAVFFGAKKAEEHIGRLGITNALDFAKNYLQVGSGENSLQYCTLAFLITDINQRDKHVKATYTAVLKGYQRVLTSLGVSRDVAVQISVLLIGGLAMSRAVVDEQMKGEILKNCLQATKTLLEKDKPVRSAAQKTYK